MYYCNKNNHTVHFYDLEQLSVQPLSQLFDPMTGQVTDKEGIYILHIASNEVKYLRRYNSYVKLKMLSVLDLENTVKKLPIGVSVPVRDVVSKSTYEVTHEAPVVEEPEEEEIEEEDEPEPVVKKVASKRKVKRVPVVEVPVEEEPEEEEPEEEEIEEELEEEPVVKKVAPKKAPSIKKTATKKKPVKKAVKKTVKKTGKAKKK